MIKNENHLIKWGIMSLAKNWIFNLYFNCKGEEGRNWAETKRDEALAYMKKTMERMSRFSVIAKDGNKSCLLLRGYMNLNNACTRGHVKKFLGKYSNCKMAAGGDIVNLLRYFNIDRNITVTGELPSQSRKRDDARWVVKLASDKGDDFWVKPNSGGEKNIDEAEVDTL